MGTRAYRPEVFRKAGPAGPADRTFYATVALQIGAASYFLVGTLLIVLALAFDLPATIDPWHRIGLIWLAVTLSALFIGVGALSLVLAHGLRCRSRSSWRNARVLFIALYLTTILLPVGIVGLYGLMSEGTRTKLRDALE